MVLACAELFPNKHQCHGKGSNSHDSSYDNDDSDVAVAIAATTAIIGGSATGCSGNRGSVPRAAQLAAHQGCEGSCSCRCLEGSSVRRSCGLGGSDCGRHSSPHNR